MSPRRRHPENPEVCPVCGEDVPPGAKACPECGADHLTGWDEESTFYDGLDLPDGTFDDEDSRVPHSWKPHPLLWSIAGILLLIAFLWAMLGGRW